jgi:glycine cleavage system H protein
MAYPKEFRYTREHEWIKVDGGKATIGITTHAQEALGDIVFVELPKVGDEVSVGKSFSTVESVKAVSEIYAPASGKVEAINEELNTAPEKINSDAHGAWLVSISLSNPSEVDALLDSEAYDKYVAEEGSH